MANNKIKGLTIQIGADTLGLDEALKGVEQKSKKAASEIRDITKAIKNTGDSAVLWDQKQKLLNTALDESKKKLGLLIESQKQVEEQFRKKNIGEEQYRAFQREVEYAKSAVDKYEKELSYAKDKVRELGNVSESASDDINDFGNKTEEAGEKAQRVSDGGLTAMKVALGNLIADGIRAAGRELKDFTKDVVMTGMSFESSMSNVAAISGATSSELEQLEEKAKEMGATTKFTASESADAFGYMALAGWNVTDMLSGIDGVLELAASSNMDLARASDIVTDYLTAFGLTSQDSSRFVDIMTYAMANSNTTTEMLGEAYKNCAATAASMGYSVEDTTAVLMTMANAGIKGGEAGTALNAIMTRLATDTKSCATELAEYGVNVYDAEGNMQSLSSILEGVSGHWETLTDQQQASLAKMLAGTNHYSALQTIMSGLSESAEEAGMSFGDYTAALEKCDGAASDMSSTMIDNLQGDMTILESAVDGLKLSLSDELNPILRDTAKYVTEHMPEIEEAIKPIFKAAVSGLEYVIKNIPDAINTAKKIIPVVTGIGAAFATIKVVDSVKKATGAIGALWTAVAANPILAVVGAAAALTAGIISMKKESQKAREAIIDDMTSESRALSDNVQADIDKMKELRDTAREQTEIDLAKTYKTETLYNELQTLVDENGKVKKGYEDRVNYIIGELQSATGIEIQQIDGVIQKYDELQGKIEETLKKQRAQIFEKNYTEMYSEALVQNSQAAGKIVEAKKIREDSKAYIDELNERVKLMFQPGGKMYDTNVTYEEASYDSIEDWRKWGVISNDEYNQAKASLENYVTSSDTLAKLQAEISQNNNIIEHYEKGEEALANGNYSLAQGYFAGIVNESAAAFGQVKGNADEAVNYYKEKIDEVGKKSEEVAQREIKYGDTEIKAEITELVEKMKADGLSGADILATGIVDRLSKIDGFDTSALEEFMKQTGITFGEILATQTTDSFGNYFPDSTVLIDMYYKRNHLINRYSINSESDARAWKEYFQQHKDDPDDEAVQYFRSIGWHASGGSIGIGQAGIVAEAGPELLQVMNGGIKITPLSRTATNTQVGAGGGTTIHNYYNTVYAQVAGKYDVYGMAEDLATAERRIDKGKGK